MAFTFNVPEGETIARELLIAYLNTGTEAAPVWSPIGNRVIESSEEFDWGEETSQDILGRTVTIMKKPSISQTFDAWLLSGGDAAQQKIYQLAIIEQNNQALTNMDMMIGHWFTTDKDSAAGSFAERYRSSMVKPSGLGGEGGGNIEFPVDVTYGGERTVGSITKGADGTVSFAADETAAYALNED